ncbi:hypothetical protein BCON_0285g00130 [Botryotinia convoluta]|uniref:Uncharacterized protein n=1 Tax=Botryotinia convoluta TaxID=54673 RepID=A0A4Z1HDM4_9HELO|nr:hypothetical protein BCON_0285g00130 [Botryotinia convoluta]
MKKEIFRDIRRIRRKNIKWAQEWESKVVELSNTNGKGWSERDLAELGENLIRTLAKAIDPVLSPRVAEYYLNASQSATTAPLSIGRIPSNPRAHPTLSTKVGSQLRAIDLDSTNELEYSKVCSFEHYDGKDLDDSTSRSTRIAAPDTLKHKGLKNLPSKESKVPPIHSRLPRSSKSTPFQSGISRLQLQSSPKISGKNGLVKSSVDKNVTKDHGLRNDQSNTVESEIPKKQQVGSYTYRREKIVALPKTLKLVIMSSDKADACRYEVVDSEWVLSESTLLRSIVYDQPHPIEQLGRLKMVIRDDDSITIKWNEVIGDYARCGKPPAIVIQSWGLDFAFKALGPWFERVTKNSGEWETWSADELINGSKADWFIGARVLHAI